MPQHDTAPAAADALLPVVVIGGGLGGTAAGAFLAHSGIQTVVLERHAAPIERPRAWITSPRTLELLRELGVDSEVTRRGTAGAWNMVQTTTLLDAPTGDAPADESEQISATGSAACDQDILEDVLRRFAVAHGTEYRWDADATNVTPHGKGVRAHLADGSTLDARYAIIAEGSRAELVERIGIPTTIPDGGHPDRRQRFEGFLFHSNELDTLLAETPGNVFVCTDSNVIVFRRNQGRWQLQRQGTPVGEPDDEIAAATGRRIAFDLIDQTDWEPSAHSADRLTHDNVFLIGDAAHSFPPSLGMGGNAAIADAHNLAWKLRWVLTGKAGPDLLRTYEAERGPMGTFLMHKSIEAVQGGESIDLLTAQLGLGYPAGHSSALLGSGDDVTVIDPHNTVPMIGARLPHSWLADGRSTVDLVNMASFAAVGAIHLPDADLQVTYTRVPTLPDAGAPEKIWLIRPDGHVAAHVLPDEVNAAMDRVLSRVHPNVA